MCGTVKGPTCVIPNQNKDVCKTCDSSFWLLHDLNVLVKFCKGCKKFSALQDFDDKPEASKCAKCRKRGRQNYYSRKQEDDDITIGTTVHNKNNANNNPVLSANDNGSGPLKMTEGKMSKEQRKVPLPTKAKKDKRLSKHPSNSAANGMILNKKALNKLQAKDVMNESGDTDQSASTLNMTSSTSSESCPSPSSYHTSGHSQQHQQQQQQQLNHYHHPNHSFSSPSFNDTSELDILGFHPYETTTDLDTTEEGSKNADIAHTTTSGHAASSSSLQIPFPYRPTSEASQSSKRNGSIGNLPPHPFKMGTPSRSGGHKNGGEPTCPDSTSSIVSCSSDSGGAYFSNSYLWPDSLREMEQNSLSGQGANGVGRSSSGTEQHPSHPGQSHPPSVSNALATNPMSCFQLPTGYPSTVKKSRTSTKGVGYQQHPDNRGSSRGSSGGAAGSSSGVAHDRRESRDSGKASLSSGSASSSSSSSKNSSLSSIGSAGGFAINQFGDLGSMGIINQANTPGLLLSITPQSAGMSFTPHGPGGGGGGTYDVITPFSGTPMFSHSPFDSINTPDSNWKWDPSANALMNLASLSAEVLTNTPPAEEHVSGSPGATATAAGTGPGAGAGAESGRVGASAVHNLQRGMTGTTTTSSVPARKCNSDPGKSTVSTLHAVPVPPAGTDTNTDTDTGVPSGMHASTEGGVDFDRLPSITSTTTTTAENRTSVMSDHQSVHLDTARVSNNLHIPSSSSSSHQPPDDNIYQIALDSSQSFELSPPMPVGKKRSFQRDSEEGEGLSEDGEENVTFSSSSPCSSSSSSSSSTTAPAPIPVKKLRL